jgi:hypothetical protein
MYFLKTNKIKVPRKLGPKCIDNWKIFHLQRFTRIIRKHLIFRIISSLLMVKTLKNEEMKKLMKYF